MFFQIHTLTSYHASLLNRDDAGLAKRIPFGNADRLRISSQCLKRSWTENLRTTLSLPRGMRTRHFFSREILPRLVSEGIEEETAKKLVSKLIDKVISSKEERSEGSDSLDLKQPVLFGKPEADYMISLIKEAASEGDNAEEHLAETLKTNKQNFKAMLKQAGYGDLYAGIEGALFGRFVTSDILARSDASVHVAHSFTIHRLDTEVDYFTVVDDLLLEEETGAAHAGDMELGTGIFYGYVVVDVPLLISNLTGCDAEKWREQEFIDAIEIMKGLVNTITTVSPGAKLGSTAPYSYADIVLIETGEQQPRSLANAYLQALSVDGDILQGAVDALGKHMQDLDMMYGKTSEHRFVATIKDSKGFGVEKDSLSETVESALRTIF